MPPLVWNAMGERYFETGVDRGVLYLDNEPGVAWSGLLSVEESPSGGESRPFYMDGIKYLNLPGREEFEATIEAYTYPEQFGQCDGTYAVGNGLFVKQQRRKPFGFCYRTRVGNDIDNIEHAYKIHIVYDALAEPSSVTNESVNDEVEPLNFSWSVTTKPSVLRNFAPTANFVIDSRTTPGEMLRRIEDILYGTEQEPARLPAAIELAYLFTSYANVNFDAGEPFDVSYDVYDAGAPDSVNQEIFDGGAP